ncbi:MAG: type III-B CRISPR-associated protein Cas10/Cmr2 [Bacteroidota bacterium]
MKYFYGLTIGPIVKTILQVRATRELWGASYLFSEMMKRIVGALEKEDELKILSPSKQGPKKALGVGLYPDHLFVEGPEEGGTKIQTIIREVLDGLSGELADDIGNLGRADMESRHADLKHFFRNYFQTYLVSLATDQDEIPIKDLQQLMHNAELSPPYQAQEMNGSDAFFYYLAAINQSSLKKGAFGQDTPEIASLPEIGIKELIHPKQEAACKEAAGNIVDIWRRNQSAALQLEIKAQKTDNPTQKATLREAQRKAEPEQHLKLLAGDIRVQPYMRNYHKYVAIVYADGDNIGKTIGKLEANPDTYQALSHDMLKFGEAAAERIKGYGGLPVYLGGDDLLFFAPVKILDRNIFSLSAELDDLFREYIPEKDDNYPPSLSFGISISYHKFPLREALSKAHELLDSRAKRFPFEDFPEKKKGEEAIKNTVSFRLLKHAGHEFGQSLPIRKSACFPLFSNLLSASFDEGNKLLSSVVYKMSRSPELLDTIGEDEERLAHYFKETFQKEVHQGAAARYLQQTRALVLAAYQDAAKYAVLNPNIKKGKYARETIYSLLRTLQFLNQKYHD